MCRCGLLSAPFQPEGEKEGEGGLLVGHLPDVVAQQHIIEGEAADDHTCGHGQDQRRLPVIIGRIIKIQYVCGVIQVDYGKSEIDLQKFLEGAQRVGKQEQRQCRVQIALVHAD